MNLLFDTLTQGVFGLLIECVIIGGHLSMVYRRHCQAQRQATAQALDAALRAYVESLDLTTFSITTAKITHCNISTVHIGSAPPWVLPGTDAIDWDTLTPDDTNFLRKNLLQWDDNNPSTEESQ